ncbi:MAG: DUF3187 family protein [Woeseia sp.]
MNIRFTTLVAAGFLLVDLASADALMDRDNGPLTGLFGFPDSSEGGRLEAAGEQSWGVNLVTSSHSSMDTNGGESILLDGETNRIGITYRRGIGERLELGIEIPYVLHESGNLDSFIDQWHGMFGLPDGIRDERAKDQLLFSYEDSSRQLIMNRNASGVGDVRLLAGWQLATRASGITALRFGIKLPTGDSERLLGSGGTDVSIGIAADHAGLWGGLWGVRKLDGFYRANATFLGRPDILAHRSNKVVGQVSAGLGYRVSARTSIALQALLRSPVYDSGVASLGDVAAALTMGIRFRLSENYRLSLAVVEDVHVESLPDVTFVLSLHAGAR